MSRSVFFAELDHLQTAYTMVQQQAKAAVSRGHYEVGAYLYREASRIAAEIAIRAEREELSTLAFGWDDCSSVCLEDARRYEAKLPGQPIANVDGEQEQGPE